MSINGKKLFTILSVICLTAMLAVPAFAQSASLEIDPAGECVEGDAIVFTATAEGFTEPEYRFLYRVSGGTKIYTGQDREGSVWETTAPAGSAGTYDVAVQVREAGVTGWPGIGDPGFDMFEGYEILPPLEPSVTLTINPADTAVEGQEVTFTAESENVVDPEYRFLYRVHGGTKLYVPQIGTDNVWTETAPPGSAGTWDFGVQVREVGTSGWPTYDVVEAYVITEEDPVDVELEVVSVEAISDVALNATFSEAVTENQAGELSYDVTGPAGYEGVASGTVQEADEAVELALTPAMTVSGTYTMEGIDFEYAPYLLVLDSNLILLGDTADIWLQNNTSSELVIDSLNIRSDTGEAYQYGLLPVNSSIPAGDEAIIWEQTYADVGEYVLDVTVLKNSSIILADSFNVEVTDETFELKFVVEDPDEVKLEGAEVEISRIGSRTPTSDVTDVDGEAAFDVVVGTYEYVVSYADYYDFEGAVEVIDVAVEEAVTLVPYATVTVTVENEAGDPIPNAAVAMNDFDGNTDTEGEVEFVNVEEGDYTVEITRVGYSPVEDEVTVGRVDVTFPYVLEALGTILPDLEDYVITAGEVLVVNLVNNENTDLEFGSDVSLNYVRYQLWNAETETWTEWRSDGVETVAGKTISAQDIERIIDVPSSDLTQVAGEGQIKVRVYLEGSRIIDDEVLGFTVEPAAVDDGESSVTRTSSSAVEAGNDNVTVEMSIKDQYENLISGSLPVTVKVGDWFDEEVEFVDGEASVTMTVETAAVYSDIPVTVDGVEIGTFNVTINPAAAAEFEVEVADLATDKIAGVAFDVTITAVDEYGNTAVGYVGNRSLFFTGLNAIGTHQPTANGVNFSNDTTINFTSGEAVVSVVAYAAQEDAVITVVAGALSGDSDEFNVVAAGPGDLTLTGETDVSSAGDPVPEQYTAKVTDEFGNPVAGIAVEFAATAFDEADVDDVSVVVGDTEANVTVAGLVTDGNLTAESNADGEVIIEVTWSAEVDESGDLTATEQGENNSDTLTITVDTVCPG